MTIKNIYIHIPFCNNICSYCDFPKLLKNKNLIDKYLNQLELEIKSIYKNEEIETLYIGGGTPSSLSIKELEKLFKILEIINKNKLLEYTFEINIEDIEEELLKLLKLNKVNRLSIGMQTTNKKILKELNRNNLVDYQEKIDIVKKYFDNINIDLIYGYKNQTKKDLDKDLDFIIKNNIKHISTYSLIIEKNTLLYINNYQRLDDDKDSKYYYHIIDRLKSNNYKHYEISNFSKDNYESRHNLCYWNNDNYYGFGLGASSYINNIRINNTRNLNKYLEGNYISFKEELNKLQEMEYEMILGLRKIEGVSKSKFYNKFKKNIKDIFNIEELINKKLIKESEDNIYISEDKLYIENSILINFIGVSNE